MAEAALSGLRSIRYPCKR